MELNEKALFCIKRLLSQTYTLFPPSQRRTYDKFDLFVGNLKRLKKAIEDKKAFHGVNQENIILNVIQQLSKIKQTRRDNKELCDKMYLAASQLKRDFYAERKRKWNKIKTEVLKDFENLEKNGNSSWFTSRECRQKMMTFHHKNASINSKNFTRAKKHFDELQTYLNSKFNECTDTDFDDWGLEFKEILLTGSVEDKLNLPKDEVEFDCMFVFENSKSMSTVPKQKGLFDIFSDCKTKKLKAQHFREHFKKLVERFSLKYKDTAKKEKCTLKTREHGPAVQLDIELGGVMWYMVDCVPSFQVGKDLFVPKPIKQKTKQKQASNHFFWRRSYSIKEKEALAKSYESNGKQAIRIVKALVKMNKQNIFKKMTSFLIKTSAMHLSRILPATPQQKKYIGAFVFTVLNFLQRCLEENVLMHFFDKRYNLLENTQVDHKTMIDTLNKWMTSKTAFYQVLGGNTSDRMQSKQSVVAGHSGEVIPSKESLVEPVATKLEDVALSDAVAPAPRIAAIGSNSILSNPLIEDKVSDVLALPLEDEVDNDFNDNLSQDDVENDFNDNLSQDDVENDFNDNLFEDDVENDFNDNLFQDDVENDFNDNLFQDDVENDFNDNLIQDDVENDFNDNLFQDDVENDFNDNIIQDDVENDFSDNLFQDEMDDNRFDYDNDDCWFD